MILLKKCRVCKSKMLIESTEEDMICRRCLAREEPNPHYMARGKEEILK
jgi:hypothetical protein